MSDPENFDPLLTCLTREQLLTELTDVLYINEQFKKEVAELEVQLSDAKEALDGKSLCLGKGCKMHCGYGGDGCEPIKAYLKDKGGQID